MQLPEYISRSEVQRNNHPFLTARWSWRISRRPEDLDRIRIVVRLGYTFQPTSATSSIAYSRSSPSSRNAR
jgi:hypothetical protein